MSDIDKLIKEVLKFRDERDWKRFHTPKDLTVSISLEAAELLAHFQWVKDQKSVDNMLAHKSEIAEEIADVLIYLILLANELGVSLVDIAFEKLRKNGQRYPAEIVKGSAKKYTEF